MKKFKPTRDDCRIIRDCAQRSAGYGKVEICPSTKSHLTDRDIEPHMNILFVSSHPTWDDTDLCDNSFAWRDFTRGVELTPAGDGIFDFYVYGPIGHNIELQTNVQAHYKAGVLVRVDGTCNGTMWPPATKRAR